MEFQTLKLGHKMKFIEISQMGSMLNKTNTYALRGRNSPGLEYSSKSFMEKIKFEFILKVEVRSLENTSGIIIDRVTISFIIQTRTLFENKRVHC